MEILAIEDYEDRGLIRQRIEYVTDLGERRVADSHCTILGTKLGETPMECVRSCFDQGHFSKAANDELDKLSKDMISQAHFDSFVKTYTQYPALRDD